MDARISIQEIPLFFCMPRECFDIITANFELRTGEALVQLVTHNETVPGLFVVMRGSFEVVLPGSDLPIAVIERGGSVGEMSFIDVNTTASASVRCGESGAEYIFCARSELTEILTTNLLFAQQFYRGAAWMMSERLRHTNKRITEQVEHASKKLNDFMREIEVVAKLDKTKNSLDETGFSIVSRMNVIASGLRRIEEWTNNSDDAKAELSAIQKQVSEVMLGESQNFDRICQMLDQLNQHFDNLKAVVHGSDRKTIKGDLKLFDKAS